MMTIRLHTRSLALAAGLASALLAGCANTQSQAPSSRNSISAFWPCMRFSASSQTTDWLPSITSALTSSPRCAGRQCMNRASGLAQAIISLSTHQSAKAAWRAASSASQPMLVQTSVVTRSAPAQASCGVLKNLT